MTNNEISTFDFFGDELELVDAKARNDVATLNTQFKDIAKKNINTVGTPLSNFPRLDGEVNDSNRIVRAFQNTNHVVLDSDITVNGFVIPDNCKFSCNSIYTITTTGTIEVGYQSYFIGNNLTIDATACDAPDLKIISLSKWAKVVVYQILGYQNETSQKGDGATAIAVYCEYSDFIQVDILRAIKYCKIAFFIKSGASGTGSTVNRSYLNCAWVGSCYKTFVSNQSTSIMLDTSAYIEQCTIGYELRAGFYGSHFIRFDHVDNWFINLLPEFRTRLGDVYIRGCTISQLLPQIQAKKINENEDWNINDNLGIEENDRFFMYTTWHCSDGVILPSDKDNPFNPQILSDPNGRLVFGSGTAKLRIISAQSIQRQGKENENDTSGGMVYTLGGDYSKVIIERQDGIPIVEVDKIGNVSNRAGLIVGNSVIGNADVNIKKGGIILGRTPTKNGKNCMLFYNSDVNKLQFIDKDGKVFNVSLETT